METLITLVIALSILSIFLLVREIGTTYKRISTLESKVDGLEKANLQRLPYRSFEELLNAMTAIDKEIQERNFQISLLENAAGHISNAMAAGTKRAKQ